MTRPVRAAVDVDAGVEAAWAGLTGPAWPAALGAALRDDSRLVRRDETADGGVVLVVSRRLPEGVPSALQRFLPGDGRVTQTDTWGPPVDGVRRGSWSVGWPGAPGRVAGETAVVPSGGGSRWTVDGAVEISVPLLGGRVEALLAPLLEKLAVRQGEVLRELVSAGA